MILCTCLSNIFSNFIYTMDHKILLTQHCLNVLVHLLFSGFKSISVTVHDRASSHTHTHMHARTHACMRTYACMRTCFLFRLLPIGIHYLIPFPKAEATIRSCWCIEFHQSSITSDFIWWHSYIKRVLTLSGDVWLATDKLNNNKA